MTHDPKRLATRRERRAQARLEAAPARTRRTTRRPERPGWQSPLVLVTGAAVLIGIAIIAFARPPAASDGELIEPPTNYAAELTDGDALGLASAPVVMEVYSDFQCPACKLLVTTQLPSLYNDFVTTGVLRVEARDIDILGRASPNESLELAVGAACAAEQDRYWQFHDLAFWNQGRENQGDHNAAFLARVAVAAGVDQAAWEACIARDDLRTAVDTATRAALAAGINQTPTLVVNGEALVGVRNYAELADRIRALASGAPATGEPSSPAPAASASPS
jgi:protein-disulfide isomerase